LNVGFLTYKCCTCEITEHSDELLAVNKIKTFVDAPKEEETASTMAVELETRQGFRMSGIQFTCICPV
jgi:hypothetical protein